MNLILHSLKIYENVWKEDIKIFVHKTLSMWFIWHKSKVLVHFFSFCILRSCVCKVKNFFQLYFLKQRTAVQLAALTEIRNCCMWEHGKLFVWKIHTSFCLSTGFLFWACSVGINLYCHLLHACRFCKPAGSY